MSLIDVRNKFITAYYEITNWFFVKRTIRKHKRTADWDNYNLRADWIGRIYTVLNPISPGDDGDTEDVLRIKYAERMKPINLYLDGLGLSESIYPAYENPKENPKALLIVYSPIFNVITTWKIINITVFLIIFFATKLDTWTWKGISKLISWIALIF